jgi:hypothetical protein
VITFVTMISAAFMFFLLQDEIHGTGKFSN